MKLKKVIPLLMGAFLSLGAPAQTYADLWKQVDKASRGDLPRTALDAVTAIERKAAAEGDDAQLLKAALMRHVYSGEISPDTARQVRQRMELALAAEERPVVKALWHSALAKIYEANRWNETDGLTEEEADARIRSHYAASVAEPEVLMGARVKDWLPLLGQQADSRFFRHDLYHVLLGAWLDSRYLGKEEKAAACTEAAARYEAQGAADAALLLTLRALTPKRISGRLEDNAYAARLMQLAADNETLGANVRTYEELMRLYGYYSHEGEGSSDRERADEAHNDSLLFSLAQRGLRLYGDSVSTGRANTLRNFLNDLQTPEVKLAGLPPVCYPGAAPEVKVRARNVKRFQLRLTPLFDSAEEYDRARRRYKDADEAFSSLAAKRRNRSLLTEVTMESVEPWRWGGKMVTPAFPGAPGVYWAELIVNGKSRDVRAVHLTALRTLVFNLPDGVSRLTVLDSESGMPVAGAAVAAYDRNRQRVGTYKADEAGEVEIRNDRIRYNVSYYVSAPGDAAAPAVSVSNFPGYDRSADDRRVVLRTNLFTDRAIYRPGQEVMFSGVVFRREADDFRVLEGLKGRVNFYNVNRRLVDSLDVTADEFGNFSGTFRLPEGALPGRFLIRAELSGTSASASIRVEEYKRPTFTAKAAPVTEAYAAGDTVSVTGTALTYTGVPVADAEVRYTVSRAVWRYWGNDDFEPQEGTARTDAEGRFAMPVHLIVPDAPGARYTFTVSYTVTAPTGETAQGSAALHVAGYKAVYEAEIPESVCKENVQPFRVRLVNAAGETMSGDISYTLVQRGTVLRADTCRSGASFTPVGLEELPSGAYELRLPAASGVEALVKNFYLLSETDRHLEAGAPKFLSYVRKNEAGDSATVLIGVHEKEAALYYDLVTVGGIVGRRRLLMRDSVARFDLAYRPEYGDGATACFAFVKNGELHSFQCSIVRPQPDKRLCIKWSTFRSRLTPGQQEEWRLTVTTPDGRPADAAVMARMYDASLDAFAREDWNFGGVDFLRRLPGTSWAWEKYRNAWSNTCSASLPFKRLKEHEWRYSDWHGDLFSYYASVRYRLLGSSAKGVVRSSAKEMYAEATADGGVAEEEAAAMNVMEDMAAPKAKQMAQEAGGVSPTEAPGLADVSARSNFSETALFCPRLRTDSAGGVNISFTLPESMTEWNFTALAYDRTLRHGRIGATVTARKEFMVEPVLPRFVRKGDRTALPVKLTNLSGKAVTADLRLTLSDALAAAAAGTKAPAALADFRRHVTLAPGEVKVLAFDFAATADAFAVVGDADLLLCRVVAAGEGFSDGEEHYLPVLSDLVEVTRTLPFSLREKGEAVFRTDTLFSSPSAMHRSLTVELASNPTWYAVTALPVLAGDAGSISATEWATRFYALAIGDFLCRKNPEIRRLAAQQTGEAGILGRLQNEGLTDDTPWLRRQDTDRRRTAALSRMFDEEWSAANRHTALDKLAALQRADGSWSWYPGMPGNTCITVDAAILLARAEQLTGNSEGRRMLKNARRFLKKEMAEEVKEMKRREKAGGSKQSPTEVQMRYLYLLSLSNEPLDDDARFLLGRAVTERKELTMYGKALSAVVFSKYGQEKEAALGLQSLMEHTVASGDMGRWFDTPRAEWSWRSYRIPTQCAAIEALTHFGRPADDMRLWLLQAKRTQMWETSRASADAVYALLAAPSADVMPLSDHTPLLFTLSKGRKTVAANAPADSETPTTVGYFKHTYSEAPVVDATTLKVDKRSAGLSWGSLYATFTLPAGEVKTEGKGLALQSRFEVKREGKWLPLKTAEGLKKGDRVRRVYVVTADRDYDFVQLDAARPACLVPAAALSGYQWNEGLPAYRVVRDAATAYYIEHVRKGTHVFAEDLFVDRAGVYSTGIARIGCVFAPEFCGTAASVTLEVK